MTNFWHTTIENHPFLMRVILFVLLYALGYFLLVDPFYSYASWQTSYNALLAHSTKVLYNVFFIDPIETHPLAESVGIWKDDYLQIRISKECSAVKMFLLHAALSFSFLTTKMGRILCCASGLIALFAMNIFRMVVVLITLFHFPSWFHFVHEIAFVFLLYALSVGVWWKYYLWEQSKVKITS